MEMKKPEFTMGDIWQELAKELGISPQRFDIPSGEFFTASEFSEAWGVSVHIVRRGLSKLKKKGVLIVGKKSMLSINDRWTEVSAYAIREEREEDE